MTMDPLSIIILVLIVIFVGVLIGSIGVGGVLLVPALTYLCGVSVHVAIAAAMVSYLFSGLVGAVLYARKGSISWVSGGWLCLGAMPGAYIGAMAVSHMPADSVKLAIAIFVVFAGVNALVQPGTSVGNSKSDSAFWLIVIGLFVGFCSAMTGTGGPLVLVPLLVWMNWPVLSAVGLSQLIQLPVSLLATLGNINHGQVDFTLGLGIAVVMVIGVTIGAKSAHRLPAASLRRIVGVVLGLVGSWMLWQTAQRLL